MPGTMAASEFGIDLLTFIRTRRQTRDTIVGSSLPRWPRSWSRTPAFKSLSLVLHVRDWIGLDLFNDDTRPSGHISRPTQVNVSQSCLHSFNNYSSLVTLYTSGGYLTNYIISDRRIPLSAGIVLCKSQELFQREHSTSGLCSIHNIPVTMHTPAAYSQWSVFDHNSDN